MFPDLGVHQTAFPPKAPRPATEATSAGEKAGDEVSYQILLPLPPSATRTLLGVCCSCVFPSHINVDLYSHAIYLLFQFILWERRKYILVFLFIYGREENIPLFFVYFAGLRRKITFSQSKSIRIHFADGL